MDKNDFSNLGDDIKKTVKSSIDSMDFEGLRRDVLNSVNVIVGDVQNIIKTSQDMKQNQSSIRRENDKREYRYRYKNGANEKFDKKYNSNFDRKTSINSGYSYGQSDDLENTQNTANYRTSVANRSYTFGNYRSLTPAYVEEYKRSGLVTRNPIGRISGILYIVFGSVSTGVFGLLFLIFALVSISDYGYFPAAVVLAMLMFTIISFGVICNGVRLRRRVLRFNDYVFQLKGRKYCNISELSEKIGESNKYVVRDLRRMMRLRMFREAHIDKQGTYFMLDDETYQQYLQAQNSLEARNYEQLNKSDDDSHVQDESPKQAEQVQATELEKTIEEGKGFITEINLMNQAIKGEEISNKLDRLECIIQKIFDYVKQHPQQISEIHRFMDYYFPMTLKLVHAYKELDEQPVPGENISKTKKEIESTLDTINWAFEKFLDSLFQDMALDISSDISVLNTMLAQEGLSKRDFE